MISVVIPYKKYESSWFEILFSIRSIRTNFKEEHEIVVVGDAIPEECEARHIYHPGTMDGSPGEKVRDQWNKLLFIIQRADITNPFVYTYDDVIFNNPCTLKDIRFAHISTHYNSGSSKHHKELLDNTYTLLGIEKPVNAEGHAPRLFDKNKLAELIRHYNIDRNKHCLATTLYVNHFNEKTYPAKQVRASVTGRFPLASKLDESTFFFFNDSGLTPDLKKYLINRFPTQQPKP